MGLLTAQQCFKLIDKLTLAYMYARGSSGSPASGLGDGSWGMSAIGNDIRALIEASADSTFADADLQAALVSPARNLKTLANHGAMYNQAWGGWISELSSFAGGSSSISSTINDLDTFMRWWNFNNGSSYNQTLCPPEWRYAYYYTKGGKNTYPHPKNVYYPIKQGQALLDKTTGLLGAASTNGMGKRVITSSTPAAFVQGDFPDLTMFAGGFGRIKWTGGGGSGAYQITVAGLDQDGNAETWRLNGGSSIAATSTGSVLTPQTHGYSLMAKCTGITFDSGITDGTFYVEGWEPTGRTWPFVL